MKRTSNLVALFVAFVLLFAISTECFAGQTAYQQRMTQIAKKYYPILIGRQLSAIEMNSLLSMGSVEEGLQSMFVVYMRSHTQAQATAMSKRIDNEIFAARKLMTKAEKAAVAEKQLEQERGKVRITDYGRLMSDCTAACDKWAKKGEYETTEAYNARIQSQAKAQFDSICHNTWDDYKQGLRLDKYTLKIKDYDADKERFPIHCHFIQSDAYATDKIDQVVYVSIPFSEARAFKEQFGSPYLNSDQILEWGTKDFIIFPTKIKKADRTINLDIPGAEKITLQANTFFDMDATCFKDCKYICSE